MEDRKIEIIRNKEMLKEYFYERGLSSEIMDNPRYETILWKLGNMISKMGFTSNTSKAISYISNIIEIDANGNLIMTESGDFNKTIVTSKYKYDTKLEKLKMFRVEIGPNNKILRKTISIYNDDGIEECLGTEQPLEDGGVYFSKASRLKNRIDIIQIQRTRKYGDEEEKMSDVYQQRIFFAALEDIEPDITTIDPLETEPLLKLGMPPLYEDLPIQVMQKIDENEGNAYPLPETERENQLKMYKETNEHYGRTKAFEKGVAKYLIVKNKTVEYWE